MLNNMKSQLFGALKKNLAVTTGSLIAFSAAAGTATYELTKESVTLTLNGKKQEVRTHADTVADVLAEHNIEVRSEDYLFPSKNTPITDDLNIVWEASKPVKLTINGTTKKVWTTAKTVKDLLMTQQIQINEHDRVSPSLDAKIQKGMAITFDKAFQVKLNVGGQEQQVWATSTTVADFLKQQKITLNELDRIEPSLNEIVNENTVVKVTRVEKVTDVVEEPISFAVVTKKDPQLLKGTEKVISPGEKGLVSKHYEVILENGKEVSRKLVKTETIKKSKDRIVAVGTKENRSQSVSRGNGTVSQEFYVTATAYTANCSGCSGRTSTGISLRSNPNMKVIAVDPRIIPLGSKVYVEGYGYAIAADTGSSIRGYKIDVFFPEQSSAFRWGRKRVKVKIIK
ncbi:ubiquitin-like domain-containing protein [Bacillus alveayuensis]|uniref:ubiquitin-like domain-containing protein n=1 Tax=Aeribacillus alveayuensis TaxID=279215 RepID=UPI0005D11E44